MCGIAGIAGHCENPVLLSLMVRRMKHRGPDAEGYYRDSNIQLGHCRLSIKDLSEQAKQPFVSADESTAVIVNGEIYNFADLKKPLMDKGYRFQSESDCEVILHAYIDAGLEFVPKLNGMFAIGIWDGEKRSLFIIRDRLGIKPLYYSINENFFLFASEIKSIALCNEVKLSIDLQSLSEYLAFENIFSNRTLNDCIKLVEPGEIVNYDLANGRVRRSFYWKPEVSVEDSITNKDVYDAYSGILKESVDRHLMSDVPLGCYLSSGIDSSSVTYWASRILKKNIKTYTGYFGISGFYDEARSAKKIADFLGCDNTKVMIRPADFVKHIEQIVYHLDEPRVGAGSFSQYMVAKRASEDVKVILTGHGGDEFFAGYPVFKAIAGKRNIYDLITSSTIRELMFFIYFSVFPIIKRGIGYFLPNLYSLNMLKTIMDKDFFRVLQKNSNFTLEVEKLKQQTADEYERLFYTYLKFYLPSLFIVEDKISMAFSIESRTPLCDNELLEFALTMPLSQKLKNNELKHIPKKSMKGRLPDFIYSLPKRGFPTPIKYWFKNELKVFVKNFILDNFQWIEFFRKAQIEKMLTRFQNSPITTPFDEIRAHRVWILLNLIIYFKIQSRRYAQLF